MRNVRMWVVPFLAVAALGSAGSLRADQAPTAAKPAAPAAKAEEHAGHMAAPAAMSDDQLIASAMKAAPAAVAKDATVVAMGADGKMRTLRTGTNGFTCMPDNPETPGPDPMCCDANAMAWANAWMSHATPAAGKVGFMYMLAGGTDASNTDPFAKAPSATNHWIKTGPHVMVVGAGTMMGGYPRQADPDTSQPYVMWPDTPYEHLMLPVK